MALATPAAGFMVRVPATSANLGPGFDSLGLALSLHDRLEVRPGFGSGINITISGVGAGSLPEDESNLIVRSLLHVYRQLGENPPPLELVAHNALPHGRGLGSSSSAICAGVVAACRLLAPTRSLSAEDILRLATELEGHPDNVAPALFGALTIAWVRDDGPAYKRLIPSRAIKPVVFIPEAEMSTAVARGLQPESVPYADAVFNLSRAALLVAALTQSPELLFEATEDRLHQKYRASAMPETYELIQLLREAGFPAVVSGAGPSVMVLVSEPGDRQRVLDLVAEKTTEKTWQPWQPLTPTIDYGGATVSEELPSEAFQG